YFTDGTLAFVGEYFEGNENGEHIYYYDNGKIREERVYRLGLKEGSWKTYDVDGELVLTTTYQAGVVKKYEGVRVDEPIK
ncbi:MAG: hypothetical protein ABI772_10700, partial [Bacteroidota bacterium]